jgi:polar amino acid transport system substrate-binding protein
VGSEADRRAPQPRRTPRWAATGALLAAFALMMAGCSPTPVETALSAPTITTPTPDPKLAARVPESIRVTGNLLIATEPGYPPLGMKRDGAIEGFDIDLATAVAGVLGLQPEVRETPFSNVIPSVVINEHDVGISAMWADDSPASYVNMVTYLQAGIELAAQRGTRAPRNAKLGLCGHSVSVVEGTTYIDSLVTLSKTCREQGRKPIQIEARLDQASATAALSEGSVDAMLADGPVVQYAVRESGGQLITVGTPIGVRPYGIAINPDQPAFSDLVRDTVQEIIDSGLYAGMLATWGLESGAISKSELIRATATAPTAKR